MIKQYWKKSFRKNFFEKCCELICKSKSNSKPKYLIDKKYKNNKPEDLVTYFYYVEKIKKVAYEREINIECGSSQKSGNGYRLKNPDITFSTLDNKFKTFFECKILGENSKYISKGIERFIIEDYGFLDMPFYGMLGYVKDDSAKERQKKLQKSIKKKECELNLTNQEILENSDSQVIFKTKHQTINKKSNKNIEITHILHSWN